MKLIPWQLRDYLEFHKIYGKYPDIKNPKTMNEKVLYRKRYQCESPLFTKLADKYLVREYVADKIGEDYLIPMVACLDTIEELKSNLESFQGCVIKPNHGSRMVAIVPNQLTTETADQIIKDVKKWLKTDYSHRHGELQYKNINRKIVVESFVGDRSTLPTDFKFHTFKAGDGNYRTILEVIANRAQKKPKSTFFDETFEHCYSGDYQIDEGEKAILEQAKVLSKALMGEMDYARIDWYVIDGKLYFGEITLTPGAGLDKDIKGELDILMGELWQLRTG